MKKNKKNNLLDILKKHPILKWIFFISATIGAIATIISVPTHIYEYIDQRIDTNKEEYEQINTLSIGTSIEYVKSIFGEANRIEKCEKKIINDPFSYTCPFPAVSYKKYIFDKEKFMITIITNDQNTVSSFSIFSKTSDFNPSYDVFLSRFLETKKIVLGKTTFAELDNLKNEYTTNIEENLLGAYTAYFIKTIYSDDYATDSFFVFSTIDVPGFSLYSPKPNCSFHLLNTFDFVDGDSIDLPQDIIDSNIKNFKEECPIYGLSVVQQSNLGEDRFTFDNSKLIEVLKNEMWSYTYP
jgi:hypothetical protein